MVRCYALIEDKTSIHYVPATVNIVRERYSKGQEDFIN